jgi:hypothetical protein
MKPTITVEATELELHALASRLRMDAEAAEHVMSDSRLNAANALRKRAFYFDQRADELAIRENEAKQLREQAKAKT